MRNLSAARHLLIPLMASALLSCGDNIHPAGDAGIDAPPIDAMVCPAPATGAAGATCSTDTDCPLPAGAPDAGSADGGITSGFCFNDETFPIAWPLEGYCLSVCADETECNANEQCLFNLCMPNCCADGGCTAGRICSDNLLGQPLGGLACLPGTADIPDGDPCQAFENCDIGSECRNDPFQHPGGQCTRLNCSDDTDCAPGGDGRCIDLDGDGVPAVCVDDCAVDADCRMDEGYRCYDGGGEGLYCRHPSPRDKCTTDADCGTGDANDPWVCRTGPGFPGGYCTVEDCVVGDQSTCPIFSTCVDPQNLSPTYCADKCDRLVPTPCDGEYQCVQLPPNNDTGCVPLPPGPVPPN